MSINTLTNVTMAKGVLHVDRNITNVNTLSGYSVAGAIKDAYQVAFGESFNVSTDSVYWELIGHLFAADVAEEYKGGIFDSFWSKIQLSTNVIDIGDNVIVPDNNRWLWDWIARASR